MSPPIKPKTSRSFSKASISSFASASSEMFEAEMDSPSRALSSIGMNDFSLPEALEDRSGLPDRSGLSVHYLCCPRCNYNGVHARMFVSCFAALDSSKYVHTAIHMIVQEIRNEPCHVCLVTMHTSRYFCCCLVCEGSCWC